MKGWFLVYTKVRQERIALLNLQRQGFTAYLPLVRTLRRRKGHSTATVQAMFPRYLFIELSEQDENWAPIRSTLGVTGLVRFGNVLARVPASLIAALRATEDAEGLHTIEALAAAKGDRVRISGGAMEGYEGIFHARTGHDRVVVLLDVAGRATRVYVNSELVEPVHD